MRLRTVKETVTVTVLVPGYRLEGEIHVSPGGRLSDEVNRDTNFLPMTQVRIHDMAGRALAAVEFLALNKSTVLFISPTGRS